MTLFGGDVTLKMEAPNTVNAGSEFSVEITIEKNSIEGFARFQQELPPGFTAEPIDNGGADFSFEMQKVKYFWLILPSDEQIKIKYNVKVDKTVIGDFTIKGLFSYIDGEKKSTDLEAFNINIVPSDQVIDIAENKGITVKRQEPFVNSKGEIIINLLVNKGNLPADQFAKVQERVPDGYTAQSIDNKEAIFTYKKNEVKFLWMTLPAEQEFLISYKLIPNSGNASKNIAINGSFSYIKDGVTQTVDVIETSEYLAENSNTKPTKPTVKELHKTVSYKVQIAAGHKKLRNIRKYFRKLKMTEKVSMEMHNGWRKYTVGKYNMYKQARDHRVNVWSNTKINDAFVSAYNNGQRITVQEALMIANQDWYQ